MSLNYASGGGERGRGSGGGQRPPTPGRGGNESPWPGPGHLRLRRLLGSAFAALCLAATAVGLVVLAALLVDVWRDGARHLSWDFLNSFPSRRPAQAGIKPALVGSLWVLGLTAAFSFPIGVATGIWLVEYAPNNRLTRFIQLNIANLAGVPSIVYGILGLALLVRAAAMGRSILAGSLTLALLILPVIIIAAQEAVRAVPNSIRLGAYALGATRWQAIRHQVLPLALPGILTGTILALSRAVGEAAPLLMIGALAFVPFLPRGPMDQFTALPIQIFNWVSRPQAAFHERAAAAILVLLAVLLTLNAAAIVLRNRYSKRL
ncbi:MAG: phosphate ABC transporter permease PstA [Gemmatimonadetes bacterium]|nr:phosphate ABC transporter permease PstA [Gemmatimonadota bacterium]